MTPEENDKIKSLTNRSEIFNHVVEHLRRQGKESKLTNHAGGYDCAYRGDGGTMCAVGCLIADDEYDPTWEGRVIGTLLKDCILPRSLHKRLLPHEEMLCYLQYFHDCELIYEDGIFSKTTEDHLTELRNQWEISE